LHKEDEPEETKEKTEEKESDEEDSDETSAEREWRIKRVMWEEKRSLK